MKPLIKIDLEPLIKMIRSEQRAEYYKYKRETETPLSRICDSADALGPLTLKGNQGPGRYKLVGDVFYSRFKTGDKVEVRVQQMGADFSVKFSDGWTVERVVYPSPGKIEILICGYKPFDESNVKEFFLFKSSSYSYREHLITKIDNIRRSAAPTLLSTGRYALDAESPSFKALYDKLNDAQKVALHHLVENNLSGAIQGPPGTGKTQLLQAVISLALSSGMKVCVSSVTNAAVDSLLCRVVQHGIEDEWGRVGSSDKIQKEQYGHGECFIAPSFKGEISELKLIGSTLHKMAFDSSVPKFDLLVVDEAGQVPLFFWPFIQRLTKRLVLVGDRFQLPPVLSAKHANLPIDNLFSLFVDGDTPMLETQYRMRREIQGWSSEKFYKGRLRPDVKVANRDYFSDSPAFLTDDFVVAKKFSSEHEGKSSQCEADFITDKIEKLIRSRDNPRTVGVICPYRAQAGIINMTLQNRFGVAVASQVLVDTVERFQGQEKEAVFLSLGTTGVSEEDLKFLSDPRRLNVAVTRAKSRFFCLFNEKLIDRSRGKNSEDLNEFLRWVSHGRTVIKKAA